MTLIPCTAIADSCYTPAIVKYWLEHWMHTCVHLCLYVSIQGNKKGPVKRWDFENEEDYASYQSNREALPKYVDIHLLCVHALMYTYVRMHVQFVCM